MAHVKMMTNYRQLGDWSGSLNRKKLLMILWTSKICGTFWGFYSWPLPLALFLPAAAIRCSQCMNSASLAHKQSHGVTLWSSAPSQQQSAEMANVVGLLSTTSKQTLFVVLNMAATGLMLHGSTSSLGLCDLNLFLFFLNSPQDSKRHH